MAFHRTRFNFIPFLRKELDVFIAKIALKEVECFIDFEHKHGEVRFHVAIWQLTSHGK